MLLSFNHIDDSRTDLSVTYRSREAIQLFGSFFSGLEEICITDVDDLEGDVDSSPEGSDSVASFLVPGLERGFDGSPEGGDSVCFPGLEREVNGLAEGSLQGLKREVDGLAEGGLPGLEREVDGLAEGGLPGLERDGSVDGFACLELFDSGFPQDHVHCGDGIGGGLVAKC